MAHIFKKATPESRGIVVLTHKEWRFIKSLEKRPFWKFGENKSLAKVLTASKSYFFGVHFGAFHPKPVLLPDWAHFAMAPEGVISLHGSQMMIPLSSSHFTPWAMRPTGVEKYWDIICISKAAKIKNVDLFLKSVRRIYDLGHRYRILLVAASNFGEKTSKGAYGSLIDDYYANFDADERERFTLLKTDAELGFQGLSTSMVAYLLNQSKVYTLFSAREGGSKATKEALLCGLPVVVYAKIEGGVLDQLDAYNSVLFDSYDEAHLALIEAVQGWEHFEIDSAKLQQEFGDEPSQIRLREYFSELFASHDEHFDGALINTDNLNRRLPAHFFDPQIGWAKDPKYRFTTTDISNEDMLNAFLDCL